MQANLAGDLAMDLAANRRAGRLSQLPLEIIHSRAEAEALQMAALDAFADDFVGYSLAGTAEVCRHMLGLSGPIYTAIPARTHHRDRHHLRIPAGLIGAQCELLFTFGTVFPQPGERIDRRSVAEAISACQPAIGLLGRRTPQGPDPDISAVADFALHVATIGGPFAENFDLLKLDATRMTARINGSNVITARADAIFGHPLEAVVWLAGELAQRHKQLDVGDVVATGSCAPVLQILPGQHLAVEFDSVGMASCFLE
jgi:2-keto-4-pentenoate hydratase